MSARWMVPPGARLAHLVASDMYADAMIVLCSSAYYWSDRCKPDDGRPRCKRCLAAEAKARKGGGR